MLQSHQLTHHIISTKAVPCHSNLLHFLPCLFAKEQKITPILAKLLECKRNWIQHVNRMPRNGLPRIMKHYSPTGGRNHGRFLKRLLDTWDRHGSTSGPNPLHIDYDDDDNNNHNNNNNNNSPCRFYSKAISEHTSTVPFVTYSRMWCPIKQCIQILYPFSVHVVIFKFITNSCTWVVHELVMNLNVYRYFLDLLKSCVPNAIALCHF
jgi:hypothetical protein